MCKSKAAMLLCPFFPCQAPITPTTWLFNRWEKGVPGCSTPWLGEMVVSETPADCE